MFGALFPIVSRRTKLPIPDFIYQFIRYFGSGVIIATAFIHLLAPAWDSLTSPCLTGTWTEYDWAPAIAMSSIFGLFIIELIAHRSGARYLARHGLKPADQHTDTHNEHGHTTHGAHVEERAASNAQFKADEESSDDLESGALKKQSKAGAQDDIIFTYDEAAMAQLVGVAILEFGVVLHVRTLPLLSHCSRG